MRGLLVLAFAAAGGPVFERFAEVAFRHDNAISPERRLPESMGPGVALLDYDGDGWQDVYFTNSGGPNVLYRNERGRGFTDVTRKAGVAAGGFSIGVTTGDPDGDGLPDLFVTSYGKNILYRNNGDGTFSDISVRAGLDAPGLYTAAVFFDYDNDGDEDLYAGHFVRYDPSKEPRCPYGDGMHYCHPLSYDPWPSKLYRNVGKGVFEDVSRESGIGAHPGKAFGAVATDADNDGRLDLFVANDSVANFLFVNRGNGRFAEMGLEAGIAYSADGNPRSGMGADAADYDGDGLEDLFVANFNRERFSIYRNRGKLDFSDDAGPTGIGMATQMYSGWGLRFFDFDLDGDQDLIVVNGHPDDRIEAINGTLKHKEPILLFENRAGKFALVDGFAGNYPARGLAVGDLDNDGRPDVVIANNGEVPLILRNRRRNVNRWIGLDLGVSPAGVRVTWSARGVRRGRLINAGGSYLSAHDPRVLLGLGEADRADWIDVKWPAPHNRTDRFERVSPGRYYSLRPGGKLR